MLQRQAKVWYVDEEFLRNDVFEPCFVDIILSLPFYKEEIVFHSVGEAKIQIIRS